VLVSDVMAAFPAYIRLGSTIRRAAEVVSVSEVGQLMVLDHDGRFVGSLSGRTWCGPCCPDSKT